METVNKLDERNFDLTRILINLRHSFYIFKIIGLNADQINGKGIGRSFFGHVRNLTIESLAINICKLFEIEKNKGYKINSIHGVLQFIQDNQVPYKDIEFIKRFTLKHGKPIDANDVISTLNLVFDEFIEKHNKDLERFKNFRDKRVAHAENIPVDMNTLLPSSAIIKEFIDFGIDFYSSIQESYVGSGPIQHENETKVLISTKNLLEKLGIEDIKMEYTD